VSGCLPRRPQVPEGRVSVSVDCRSHTRYKT
jgi:hypothetical protein